jgi:hypothetical protein
MSLNQVVTFLVFFLPLKVVLLVASDGVSRYFQFFITQETKNVWIAAIVTAILILYILSIRLDAAADRYASQGARSLVGTQEQVPVTADPENFARTTFYRIGETVSGIIFILLTLAAGVLVFPAFFLSIPILIIMEFLLVVLAVRDQPPARLRRFGSFVRRRPQDLFRWLRQINFLIVFSVLICLFLLLDNLNPILGIAAILLSRRLFGAMKNVAGDSLKLSSHRRLVDALLFPAARLDTNAESNPGSRVRHASPSARVQRLHQLMRNESAEADLETCTQDADTLALLEAVEASVWVDSGRRTTAIVDLFNSAVGGQPERLFREYVYTGKDCRGLEQHDYLLRLLDAEALQSPARVLGYRAEGLVGRIVEFRGMRQTEKKEWELRRRELLETMWSLEPPEGLVQAHDSVHARLHERVERDLLGALEVAADERWAESTYKLVATRLPVLCERVAELPLMLLNGRLMRHNMRVGPDGRPKMLDWTSWTLRPVGAGLAPETESEELIQAAGERAARHSETGKRQTSVLDVLTAGLLHRMDALVQDGYPKTALGVAYGILPVIDGSGTASVDDMVSEWRLARTPES